MEKLLATGQKVNHILDEMYIALFLAGAQEIQSRICRREEGVEITFTPTEFADSHPNTAEIHLTAADGSTASLRGASVGGGRIEVVQIDGMPVSLTGEYFTLIVIHKDAPGAIAEVTRILTHYSGNICHFDLSRKARGGEAIMTLSMDALEHSDIPALCAEIEAHDIIYKCIAVQPIA